MINPCDRDCFSCPFPDCIVDEMDAEERKAHRDMEKDLMTDPERRRIAAYQKAYREKNREEIAAHQKAYYEANREEIAAYQKAYREKNREENSRFGRALRQARKAHGYTQYDLSRLLCASRSLVAQYEAGNCSVPADRLEALVWLLPELAEEPRNSRNTNQPVVAPAVCPQADK